MASTNKTTNYELPQWIGSDKPTWEGDLNSAFLKIDETMKSNSTTSTSANENANTALEKIGNLTLLETNAKDNLVNSINEVLNGSSSDADKKIGDLSSLNTTAKDNLVNAINEVNTNLQGETTSLNEQLNLANKNIGNLSELNTSNKSDLVKAINEVNTKPNGMPLITKENYTFNTIEAINLSDLPATITAKNGRIKYINNENFLFIMGTFSFNLTAGDYVGLDDIDLGFNPYIKPPIVTAGLCSTPIGMVTFYKSDSTQAASQPLYAIYKTNTNSLHIQNLNVQPSNEVDRAEYTFFPFIISDFQ